MDWGDSDGEDPWKRAEAFWKKAAEVEKAGGGDVIMEDAVATVGGGGGGSSSCVASGSRAEQVGAVDGGRSSSVASQSGAEQGAKGGRKGLAALVGMTGGGGQLSERGRR